ncbi:MAG: phosphodiester glycosidase family protein [Clostridia bacterium]|nr:phosphodiester glycosidase family protein [Clostridia bacterium]
MKKIICLIICLGVFAACGIISAFAITDKTFDGEVARTTEELYDGVTCTHITLGPDSKYGQQEIWVVEFDPTRADLKVTVTGGGAYSNKLVTTVKTMSNYADANPGLQPISAINGDLWMVTYAHARVVGSGTSYGGCKDEVVTHSLTVPRGLDMYDGEIVSSPHTTAETPYEGAFDAFGITPDGRTVLGTPSLKITCKDLTQNSEEIKLTGLNRLPANKAIMLYSDKGPEDNAALDDAYEIVIDCDYDYCIKQGAVIKGKITAICKEGDENPKMQENRLILTARGDKYIAKIADYKIGDELEFTFELKGSKSDNDIWQEVTNIVGGHIILVRNGKAQSNGDTTKYPTSIIGNTADGKIMFLTSDGRQSGYADGLAIKDMPKFCLDLGYENCFLFDGGGSATMSNLDPETGNYELVNRPSDKKDDGNPGQIRTVVNSIILSYVKPQPDPTEEPTDVPEVTAEPAPTAEPAGKKGCGSVFTSVIPVLVAVPVALFMRKRKETL